MYFLVKLNQDILYCIVFIRFFQISTSIQNVYIEKY